MGPPIPKEAINNQIIPEGPPRPRASSEEIPPKEFLSESLHSSIRCKSTDVYTMLDARSGRGGRVDGMSGEGVGD